MTCLPTTQDGFHGAAAWACGQFLFDAFDAGFFRGHDAPVAPRPTAQSALDAVCARANAARQ